MIPLQAVLPDALAAQVEGLRIEEARKVIGTIHRGGSLDAPVRQVRRVALDAVRAVAHLPSLHERTVVASALDPFVKYAFETADGRVVETVRIPLEREGRFSVCVSSQVGCAIGCAFCATGRLGLLRNLEAWEIVEQVRAVRKGLEAQGVASVHGVVFQGMGEPLANLEQVLAAVAVLKEPCAAAIDARNVTVCTSGLPNGIRRLARAEPRVRLGLSVGSMRPEVRERIMPITRAHPLPEVLAAVAEHAAITGYAPMWAVTLLSGVNDHVEDALALADAAADLVARTGVRPRITVIAYNEIDAGDAEPFARTSPEREAAFRAVLHDRGFPTHRRYSGGGDVGAACGQLAARA